MPQITSYRINEVHASLEGVLLALDPFSDEAARLRREIAQLKRVNLSIESQLERREIEIMAARLTEQGRMIGDVRDPRDTRWQRRKPEGQGEA